MTTYEAKLIEIYGKLYHIILEEMAVDRWLDNLEKVYGIS